MKTFYRNIFKKIIQNDKKASKQKVRKFQQSITEF